MPLFSNPLRCVLALALFGACLSGCFSTTVPATRFYILDPFDYSTLPVGDSLHQGTFSVEIALLVIPQYLERPQIVVRNGDHSLALAEFHQWGGNLKKNMLRVLSQNLSRLLATPDLSVSPKRRSVPPDFRTAIDVRKFERDADGRVRLSAQWRLWRGSDREPLIVRISEIESSHAIGAGDYEGTVAAMVSIWGEFSRILGEEILKHARE